jgi:hypothetical protein
MGDFPADYPRPVGQLITTLDMGAPLGACIEYITTANRAIYIPVRIPAPFYAHKMFIYNGATVSGNIDMGIYDRDGNKIASLGTTAQGTASTIQEFDMTDILLAPGIYYLAVALDNATGKILCADSVGVLLRSLGRVVQETAFPLPATATFALSTAAATVPLIGLAERILI